jgi:hypothetical protein
MPSLKESSDSSTTPRVCMECSTPYVKDQTFENHNEQGDWMCKECWVNEVFNSIIKMDKKIKNLKKKLND